MAQNLNQSTPCFGWKKVSKDLTIVGEANLSAFFAVGLNPTQLHGAHDAYHSTIQRDLAH
jgi:hypothetical protein